MRNVEDAILRYIGNHPHEAGAYADLVNEYENTLKASETQADALGLHAKNKELRSRIALIAGQMTASGASASDLKRMNDAYWHSMLLDAPVDFDAFMLYLEKNRNKDDKFYAPRRKVLRPIVAAFQDVADGKLDLLTVSQPKRTGKAVPIDTKVLTPNGYVNMGDLKVGDKVVSIGGNSTVVTGVYPQGKKRVYKVTFAETGTCKETTTIECCKDHLWTIQTEDDRDRGKYRVMSTEAMMNGRMRRGGDNHRNYSVDYIKPVQFEKRGELHIKPYAMGVLIANGGLSGRNFRFSTADESVLNRVRDEINDEIRYVDGYDYRIKGKERRFGENGCPLPCDTQIALTKYGLFGKHSYEKFIPEDYLYASIEDRIELLRGLFDSDGTVVSNMCEYSTTSKRLADDVCFLVRSLGGRCCTSERMGRYKVDGEYKETRTNYRVFCKFPGGINPFWLPRKADKCNVKSKYMRHFIDNIEPTDEYKEMVCISVADESKQYVIGDSMIPTHNTTVGTWFVLFRAGRSPNGSSVCSGAGDSLVKSFYTGMLEVLQQTDKYAYYDIFPEAKLVSTNADEKTFNLKEKKRFATVTCRPIDGQITGSTEATPDGLIYLDDTVKNEEEAINRDRLDFLWDKVRGDILGRRIEGCPIVAQGTRYSIYDPMGKLQEVAPSMGWRTKVLEIPALDENDNSNFEISVHGKKIFTTEYYRHERGLVTELQWESQFQQHPFEAKGRLFPEDQLNRFFELPDREPDAIVAACDTAEKGTDSVSMPIAYIYGEDVLIPDCVFNNSTPEHTKPECALKLVQHNVGMAQFESNSAGEYYARDVEAIMKKQGGKTSIRLKRSLAKKTTRIEVESDYILKHFYFLDRSKYKPGSEYGNMIRELCTYTRSGKVPHDDSPDSLAQLSALIRTLGGAKVEIMRRPF